MLYTSLITIGLSALHLTPQVLASTIPSSFSSLERRAEFGTIVPFPFDENDADIEALEKAFAAITETPDSVVDNGDAAAIKKWEQTLTNLVARSNNDINARSAEADAEAEAKTALENAVAAIIETPDSVVDNGDAAAIKKWEQTLTNLIARSNNDINARSAEADAEGEAETALENAGAAIIEIPDSVVENGDAAAIKKWEQTLTNLIARSNNDINARSAEADAEAEAEAALEPRQGFMQVVICAGAILKAVAENAVPVAKVRALIRAIGGVRKLARAVLKARSIDELIKLAGPEAGELAQILLGVTDVANECFQAF
jgi:hypothetical protein